VSLKPPTCNNYNLIIKRGWRVYRNNEHLSLNLSAKDCHTAGIYPFNWDNKNWSEATQTLGQADGPPLLDFQIVPVE
jgi:hypothetical protein